MEYIMFGMIPFTREESNLWNEWNNLEKSLFGGVAGGQFRCDIKEEDDKYVMEAELPGFQKEDISVDVQDGRLTITARHNSEKEDKKDNYLRRERSYGSYCRSFDLSGIDAGGITASYNNGVLELKLPKEQAKLPQKHTIAIEG